jgi:DNA-binding response OmpR family regulator
VERVLVVDDEVDALQIMAWMLAEHGCEVRTATDVEQAISVGHDFHPTVLITDYLLRDDATGFDVIRDLRGTDPTLRAVLVTGMDVGQLRHELDELGNIRVLRKPFVWADLRENLG